MKKIINLLIIIIIFITCISCSTLKEKNTTIFCFNTYIDITLYHNEESVVEEASLKIVDLFNYYHKLSDNKSYEDFLNVYTLNNSNYNTTDDLFYLIEKAYFYYQESSNYFNPFIGCVYKVYKDLINQDLTLDSFLKTNLNNQFEIIFDYPLIKMFNNTIDLGAFIKGYALNEVKIILDEFNIKYYIINAGNSSILLGLKPKKNNFNVVLKYSNELLSLSNTVIGASSIKEQNIVIDEVLYHHIINPKTLKPTTLYDTIYIINDDSIVNEVYTTAFMSMSLEEINEFITLYDFKVIIYKDEVKIFSN